MGITSGLVTNQKKANGGGPIAPGDAVNGLSVEASKAVLGNSLGVAPGGSAKLLDERGIDFNGHTLRFIAGLLNTIFSGDQLIMQNSAAGISDMLLTAIGLYFQGKGANLNFSLRNDGLTGVIASTSGDNIVVDLATGNVTFNGQTTVIDSKQFVKMNPAGAGDHPPMTEFWRYLAGVLANKGSVGYLGGTEMNISNNMDYTDGSHKYYDSSKNALWAYFGNNGVAAFGLQWVRAGHPNNDTMWTVYGKVIFKVDVIPNAVTGDAQQYGSHVYLQRIDFVDENGVSPNATLLLNDTQLRVNGADAVLMNGLRIGRGGAAYDVVAAIATFQQTGADTFIVFSNADNNGDTNVLRFLKTKAGSFNLGAGVDVVKHDINGGVGVMRWRSTANAPGGFSNVELSIDTTNAAGSTATRMTIKESGILNLSNVPAFATNALAIAGGLVTGDVYQDGTGVLRIVI